MSRIATILAVVGDVKSGRDGLALAFRVGKQLNAHVDALHVQVDATTVLPLVGEAMSGALVDEMIAVANQETETRTQKSRRVFDELVQAMNVQRDDGPPRAGGFAASWLEEVGVEDSVVAARACRADLIAVSRAASDNESASLVTLNAALLQTGRPVLAAPPAAGRTPATAPFDRICLFWNGSPAATRAITAALPFLMAARQVTVLRVEEEEWFAPMEDLAVYLARHGISGVASRVLPRNGRTAQSLLMAAQEAEADLLVMGAYTRSRMRQLIFGSVTGYIMENAALPVLLCH
jgi:nucleotide-binding universal stress UspA family protein